MNLHLKQATSLALALSLGLSLAACGADSSSSSEAASSSAASSQDANAPVVASIGPVSDFDYLNFDFAQGLTDGGFWDGVTATDYVTLPEDFANVTVPTADVTPSDESIQAQISEILAAYTSYNSVTDRPAQNGDTVTMDYSGSVGGVVFVGGTAENQTLALGSGKFIPGFEEQLVGHNIGDEFDITVTFPEGYSDSMDEEGNTLVLSGAQAVFAIKLIDVTAPVVPELTDEFVKTNLSAAGGFETVADLTESITAELFKQNKDLYITDYLMEHATFNGMPANVLNYQVCQFLSYYNSQAAYYGVDLDTFCQEAIQISGADELLAIQEDSVVSYAQLTLLQQAVAETLDLTVTDEMIESYAEYAADYPAAYIAYNALATTVNDTLVSGANMA